MQLEINQISSNSNCNSQ